MPHNELYPGLKLSNNLAGLSEKQYIVDEIKDRFLAGFGSVQDLKNEREDITRQICLIIEQMVPAGNPMKLDKKQICLDVLKKLFDLTPPEVLASARTIDFVCSLGLKKISRFRRFRRWLMRFFCCMSNDDVFLERQRAIHKKE